MKRVLKVFHPACHIDRLPPEVVCCKYPKMRWQVFIGIFVGYMSFYFLRNNFSFAMPYMMEEGYSKTELGFIFSALPLAYGFSKFIMGAISDRSNPRCFMAAGLIISAVVNLFFGTNLVLSSVSFMVFLMFLNGWCQGMGWPASARVIVHWFSKKERGTKTAIWGTAANVGAALVALLVSLGLFVFKSWHSIFYFPAVVSLLIAAVVLLTVRDTPQSQGLPPIEEHKKHHYEDVVEDPAVKEAREKELSVKEILFKYVFVNKYIWFLAFAYLFVYIIRYGVINWVPTYLTGVKGFTPEASRWAYFLFESAGIFGTILSGWASDKFFKARRAPAAIISMVIVTFGVLAYWLVPVGQPLYDYASLITIGCCIYGPMLLINVAAMDIVPKKAAGTAAGLVGLFGYVGGAVIANAGMGIAVDIFGWNGGFMLLLGSGIMSILLISLTWNAKGRQH